MLLREVRVLQKMSQQELAKRLSCCQKSISDYERGYAIPNEDRKQKLADILGVDPDILEWDERR